MKITFYKYQGTGNDFVLIDNRTSFFDIKNTGLVRYLCDRRFGIGADGLMLLQNKEGFDFEMIYYNSDGNLSSMCGNGGRCIVAFAKQIGVIQNKTHFLAVDGAHDAEINNDLVKLKMIDVEEIENGENFFYLNTGSPHFVKFVDDVESFEVVNEAKKIRYNDRFKAVGTNVNYTQVLGENEIAVRTYERGVEDETYSCGTGVTAAAISSFLKNDFDNKIRVKTLGGNLNVYIEKTEKGFENVWLEGPATFVFKGEIDV